MKRSRTVAALLLGGFSPILVACGEDGPEAVTVYPSVEACTAEKAAGDCAAAFAAARDEHLASAPRFASRAACEAEMGDGACVPGDENRGSSVGNVFVPALVGFMIGRSLTGSYAQPVYFDRQGYARSGATQIGRLPAVPERKDESRQSSGGGGGSIGSFNSYYRSGDATAGKSFTVPTAGRSAGFGSTGASRGFSGS
ncbi:DUF1190 domain-containing protein [Azospirillum isscasi]|uniref:DUF1190 domain-containing protein n=1 Tax=Azospirillum isscasi TaxID=3053926 RepID=A0ABU0WJJ5_9PROT|nr:DUF1190 domain-containing protein [Azospirillum isscasi]MDQ2104336.1 DUF1190 domain-containing protein [Azospirillum isscasi]